MPSPAERSVREGDGGLRRVVYAAFWGLFGLAFLAIGTVRGPTLAGLALGVGGFVLAGYSLVATATALSTTGARSFRCDYSITTRSLSPRPRPVLPGRRTRRR